MESTSLPTIGFLVGIISITSTLVRSPKFIIPKASKQIPIGMAE
jgi:hypothetical protein